MAAVLFTAKCPQCNYFGRALDFGEACPIFECGGVLVARSYDFAIGPRR